MLFVVFLYCFQQYGKGDNGTAAWFAVFEKEALRKKGGLSLWNADF